MSGIYDRPELYELACAYRDVRSEVDALDRWYAQHADPAGPGSVLELAHPADFLTLVPRTSSEWDSEVGGRRVHVRWGGGEDVIDPVTQVTREHVQVTVRDDEGVRTLTDVVPNRFWTGTEVTAAARLAGGLTEVARYGDFAEGVDLSDREAWRMIIVFRRAS